MLLQNGACLFQFSESKSCVCFIYYHNFFFNTRDLREVGLCDDVIPFENAVLVGVMGEEWEKAIWFLL